MTALLTSLLSSQLFGVIATLVLKGVLMLLDRSAASDATKQKFIDWVGSLSKYIPSCAQLKQSYDDARQKNLEEITKIEASKK